LQPPIPGTVLFETLLDVACRKGGTNESSVLTSIWSEFQNPIPGVQRKALDGYNRPDTENGKVTEMKFWESSDPPDSLLGMLSSPTGDGSCFSWAQLFRDALRVHGTAFETAQIYEVTSNYVSPKRFNPKFSTASFLLKNWIFTAPGHAPDCSNEDFNYLLIPTELNKGPREVKGQGNPNPPGAFFNHRVVSFNGLIYDPSFGKTYASLDSWEDSAIDGFVHLCVDETFEGKKNVLSIPEVTWDDKD
jgi:hypothetical protein